MSLAEVQRRAAELVDAIDRADDDQAARRRADELHALMDDLSNVAVLRP